MFSLTVLSHFYDRVKWRERLQVGRQWKRSPYSPNFPFHPHLFPSEKVWPGLVRVFPSHSPILSH